MSALSMDDLINRKRLFSVIFCYMNFKGKSHPDKPELKVPWMHLEGSIILNFDG